MRIALIYLSLLSFLCTSLNAQNYLAGSSDIMELNPGDKKSDPSSLEPPAIYAPEISQLNNSILFKWDAIEAQEGFELEYELVIQNKTDDIVFKVNSPDLQFLLSNPDDVLELGEDYSVRINSRLTGVDKSFIIDGKQSEILFSYIPVCTTPKNVRVKEIGADYLIIEWDGIEATPSDIQYEVRYGEGAQEKGEKNTITITTGLSQKIEGLSIDKEYIFEVRRLCNVEGAEVSKWVELDNSFGGQAQLNPILCDGIFTPDLLEAEYEYFCDGMQYGINNNLYIQSEVYIGGFKITLDPGWTSSSVTIEHPEYGQITVCSFTGSGLVDLPFGDSKVKVQFENALAFYKIKQQVPLVYTVNLIPEGYGNYEAKGTDRDWAIEGIPDAEQFKPDLSPRPAHFGDGYCQDPEWNADGTFKDTGLTWNHQGFNQYGQYTRVPFYAGYEDGDPYDPNYDPNGFDANGIHKDTGTPFNLNGCDRKGQREDGSDCEEGAGYCPSPDLDPPCPYYWLGESNTTAGKAFELQVRAQIPTLVNDALALLKTEYENDVNTLKPTCNALRTDLQNQVTALGCDPILIFGESNKYILEGMHKEFSKRPVGIAHARYDKRNPQMVAVENKHTELYDCDLSLSVKTQLLATLVENQAADKVQELVDYISKELKKLSQEEVDNLDTSAKLGDWVKAKIADKIEELNEAKNGGTTYNKPNDELKGAWGNIDKKKRTNTPYYSTVGSSFEEPNVLEKYGFDKKEIDELLNTASKDLKDKYQVENDINWEVNKFSSELRPVAVTVKGDPYKMPIAVTKRVLGKEYTLHLDDIYFTYDEGAYMDVYMVLELPENGQRIVFSAEDVNFNPQGIPNGGGQLGLNSEITIRLSNAAQLRITDFYAQFDCDGFAGLGMSADIEFCRKYVIPVNKTTLIPLEEPEVLKCHIDAVMPAWGEFYTDINFEHAFTVVNAENVVWEITDAYFDFSSTQSATDTLTIAAGYASPYYSHASKKFAGAWQGFYLKELSATITKDFAGEDSNPRKIGVKNIVIDELGFTGTAFMQPVLDLEQGNMNGWAFSVDELEITVVANQLAGGGFKGKLNMPLFSSKDDPDGNIEAKDCFQYEATFQPNNEYMFSVQAPANDLKIPMLKAGQVTIGSSSSVLISYKDKKFKTKATLNGSVEFDGDFAGISLKSGEPVTFTKVVITNQEGEYLKEPGTWTFPSSAISPKLAGFELLLQPQGLKENADGLPAMEFHAGIHLVKKSANMNLKGDSKFRIVGEYLEDNGRQRWVNKSFEIDKVDVAGKLPGIEYIRGQLEFFRDNSEYGTGFKGGVALKIKGLNADFRALAQFGTMKEPEEYKYFFVDVLSCFKTPLNASQTLFLRGIGGGVSYRMGKTEVLTGLPAICSDEQEPSIPSGLGVTLSNAKYVPNKDIGLGLKMMVAISGKEESSFNGNGTLDVFFNANNGLESIGLYGNCTFMSNFNMTKLPVYDATPGVTPNTDAAIEGYFGLEINFRDKTFNGNFEVDITTPETNFINGHGEVHVYVGPDKWFFKAGTPKKPNYVNFNLPIGNGQTKHLAEAGFYFQLGSDIDPMPAMPDKIYNLTGATRASGSFSQREWGGETKTGEGFAMGAFLKVGTAGRKEFWRFYAQLDFELGFDLLVKKWDEQIICANTNERPGVNGWFAQGQLYAYLEAGVGVTFANQDFDLVHVAGGVALQGQLPNPFWAEGAFGVEYNVMGGFHKGKENFVVEFGERCEFDIEGGIEELLVIQNTNPIENQNTFPVDGNPSIDFYYPVNSEVNLPVGTDDVTYKIELEEAKLLYGGFEWDAPYGEAENTSVVTLVPDQNLPANADMELYVKVNVIENNTIVRTEEKTVPFVTSPALDHLPETNVIGSYPLNGQFNFYKKEITADKGYIQLAKGQSSLFSDYGSIIRMRFTDRQDNSTTVPVEYDAGEKRVLYDIPSDFIQNGQLYRMEMVKLPIEGVSLPSGAAYKGSSGATENENEKVLYCAYFRASDYDTYHDKVTAVIAGAVNIDGERVNLPGTIEPFDKFEMFGTGSKGLSPLINIQIGTNAVTGSGNKPGNGAGFGAKFARNQPQAEYLYENFPKHDMTCNQLDNNTTFNDPICEEMFVPTDITFDQEIRLVDGRPATLVWIKNGGSQSLEDLIIDEGKFDAGTIPPNQFQQYLHVASFFVVAMDFNIIAQQVNDYATAVYDKVICEYPNDAALAATTRTLCLQENGIDMEYFQPPVDLPDGSPGYKIMTGYSLPAANLNYSQITLDIPQATGGSGGSTGSSKGK